MIRPKLTALRPYFLYYSNDIKVLRRFVNGHQFGHNRVVLVCQLNCRQAFLFSIFPSKYHSEG